MSSKICDPPTLFDPYHEWKDEVLIWSEFVADKIPPNKQGMALFLSLKWNARKAAAKVKLAEMKKDNGLATVLGELDNFFMKDKDRAGFLAYDKFNKFRRPDGMSVQEFLLKFELLRNTCDSLEFPVSDKVAMHQMLESVNVSALKRDVIVSTLTDYTSKGMRSQILKIFSEDDAPAIASPLSESDVVQCRFDEGEVKNEMALYGSSSSSGSSNYYRGRRPYCDSNRGKGRGYSRQYDEPRENCLDEDGNVTRCKTCGSKYHYKADCPDEKLSFRNKKRQSDPRL